MANLSNMCRVCGVIDVPFISLFDDDAWNQQIVQKINIHLPIKVHENDRYPTGVCHPCATSVLNWHQLVQSCKKTNRELAAKLNGCTQCVTERDNPQANFVWNQANKGLERSPASCLILLIKEVMSNDYFKVLNIDEDNSDLIYVCQMCPEERALTSVDCLCDHLVTCHKSELIDKTSVEEFIKQNITFEEVLNNDDVTDDESENQNSAEIPNYFCPFCKNAFSSPTRLICHLNKHIEVSVDDGVLCCDHLYADKKSFVLHLQDKHVNRLTDGLPMCKTCGLVQENHEALEVHVNEKHTEVKDEKKKTKPNLKCQKFIPAVCPECNKSFSNKYNMLHHLKTHARGLYSSKFMCSKCNKTYKSRGSLTYHQRVFHEGLLRFLCSMCGEAFPSRMARDTHARIHTGSKPFTCNYCNKSYRAQNTLSRHIDMHLNIRKYECHLCSKKFRKKTHLDYHLKTHEKKE